MSQGDTQSLFLYLLHAAPSVKRVQTITIFIHPCSIGNFFQNYMLRRWGITNPIHLPPRALLQIFLLCINNKCRYIIRVAGQHTPSHYINCCVPLCIRLRRLLHGWIAQLCWPFLAVWGVVCSSSTYSQSKPLRIGNTAPPWPRSMGYHLHSRQHAHRCNVFVLGRRKYRQVLQPYQLSHICPYISKF